MDLTRVDVVSVEEKVREGKRKRERGDRVCIRYLEQTRYFIGSSLISSSRGWTVTSMTKMALTSH